MLRLRYKLSHTQVDHDVCHLFEHLVIRTFRDVLEKNGYHPGLVGGIDATTRDDSIIFLLILTERKTGELFVSHLRNLPEFSDKLILHEVERISAEDNEKYTIEDFQSLKDEFEILRSYAREIKVKRKKTNNSPLSRASDLHNFTDTTLIFSAEINDTMLQAFAVLLRPFIIDIVYDPLVKDYPLYTREISPVIWSDDGKKIGFAWQFTHSKNLKVQKLTNKAQSLLSQFSITMYAKQYEKYLRDYALKQPIRDLPRAFRLKLKRRGGITSFVTAPTADIKFAETLIEAITVHQP